MPHTRARADFSVGCGGRHVFLRTTMLLMYDDSNTEKVELKIMNFAACYEIPESDPPLKHVDAVRRRLVAALNHRLVASSPQPQPPPPPALASRPALARSPQWDGTAESHEDGYLIGIRSLARLMKDVAENLKPKPL